MSTYDRSARQHLHYRLRCWQRIINALLALSLALAFLLALAPVASAAPRCPGGTATPGGCSYQIDRDTVCAWPLTLNGQRVTWCIWQVQP